MSTVNDGSTIKKFINNKKNLPHDLRVGCLIGPWELTRGWIQGNLTEYFVFLTGCFDWLCDYDGEMILKSCDFLF